MLWFCGGIALPFWKSICWRYRPAWAAWSISGSQVQLLREAGSYNESIAQSLSDLVLEEPAPLGRGQVRIAGRRSCPWFFRRLWGNISFFFVWGGHNLERCQETGKAFCFPRTDLRTITSFKDSNYIITHNRFIKEQGASHELSKAFVCQPSLRRAWRCWCQFAPHMSLKSAKHATNALLLRLKSFVSCHDSADGEPMSDLSMMIYRTIKIECFIYSISYK
jgi:hypothetical protein